MRNDADSDTDNNTDNENENDIDIDNENDNDNDNNNIYFMRVTHKNNIWATIVALEYTKVYEVKIELAIIPTKLEVHKTTRTKI